MGETSDEIQVAVRDAIGTITLNRPEARNALSPAIKAGLLEATRRFEADPAIRCVVLRGAGDHFMAGGDVKGMLRDLETERETHLAGFELRVVQAHQAIYQLRRMAKPVLAVTQGGVAGFGFSLAMAADFVLAATDSFFTMAYRHVGLSPDGGATYFLPRIVGERRALEIALLGERIDAATALRLGLVNWVVPRTALDAEAARIAAELAAGPTLAMAAAKRLIRGALDASWDEQSHREAEAIAAIVRTDDHLEGVRAFAEKRRPVFRGR